MKNLRIREPYTIVRQHPMPRVATPLIEKNYRNLLLNLVSNAAVGYMQSGAKGLKFNVQFVFSQSPEGDLVLTGTVHEQKA